MSTPHNAKSTPHTSIAPGVQLKGRSARPSLSAGAKHEAGHALICWLMDIPLQQVSLNRHGGVTQVVPGFTPPNFSPLAFLLLMVSGMENSYDGEVDFELREHATEPDYFVENTDSQKVAMLLSAMKEYSEELEPQVLLFRLGVAAYRLRQRFRKPFAEMVALLKAEPHCIVLEQLHDLYGKWDLEYGPDRRPKSDVVMRTIARACRWKQLPKCKWIGWDFEPLTEWRYTRPTLEEVKAKTEQPV